MELKTILFTFTILALLVTSPSAHAEDYIKDSNKAKIVMSHPFLGIEPDGSLRHNTGLF